MALWLKLRSPPPVSLNCADWPSLPEIFSNPHFKLKATDSTIARIKLALVKLSKDKPCITARACGKGGIRSPLK